MTTFLLDIDGVTHDWVTRVLNELKPWGCPVTYDQVTEYDILSVLPGHLHEPFERLPYQEGFCRGIQLYPGAGQFIRTLREAGRVVALTKASRGPFWRAERHEALSFLGFEDKDIAIVARHEDKYSFEGDVLIEDNPETVSKAKHPTKVLMSRPWNQAARGLVTATTYAEVLEKVL